MSDSLDMVVTLGNQTQRRTMVVLFTIICGLVCVLTFVAMMVFQMGSNWQTQMRSSYTLELRALPDVPRTEQLKTALMLLDNSPDVAQATPLDDQKIAHLVEPWLGRDAELLHDLPLSQLVSIHLKTDDLTQHLHGLEALVSDIPGGSLEGYNQVTGEFDTAAQAARFLSVSGLALLMVVAVIVVWATTHASLVENRQVLDVLQLLGAEPPYMTALFRRHLMTTATMGAFYGVLLACAFLTVVGFLSWSHGLQGAVLLSQILPHTMQLMPILIVPFMMVFLTWLTSTAYLVRLSRSL
jgi:cell division transport system permease protein